MRIVRTEVYRGHLLETYERGASELTVVDMGRTAYASATDAKRVINGQSPKNEPIAL